MGKNVPSALYLCKFFICSRVPKFLHIALKFNKWNSIALRFRHRFGLHFREKKECKKSIWCCLKNIRFSCKLIVSVTIKRTQRSVIQVALEWFCLILASLQVHTFLSRNSTPLRSGIWPESYKYLFFQVVIVSCLVYLLVSSINVFSFKHKKDVCSLCLHPVVYSH